MKSIVRWARGLLNRFGYDFVRAAAPQAAPAYAGSMGSHLRNLFRALQIDCVIDVGAHVGEFGSYLRRIGYRGLIVSFEPVAASFERLSKLALRDGKWLAFQVAAGSASTSMAMNVSSSTELSSLLALSEQGTAFFQALAEIVATDIVSVVRLDEFIRRNVPFLLERRIFLKLDTQGFDLEAACGAEQLLPAVMALQTEVAVRRLYDGAPSFHESIRFFEERGFELSAFFPVTFDYATSTMLEFDCVMVRTAPVVAAVGAH